jgi:hypothetical protein
LTGVQWSLALCLLGHFFPSLCIYKHGLVVVWTSRDLGKVYTCLLLGLECRLVLIHVLLLLLWCLERLNFAACEETLVADLELNYWFPRAFSTLTTHYGS